MLAFRINAGARTVEAVDWSGDARHIIDLVDSAWGDPNREYFFWPIDETGDGIIWDGQTFLPGDWAVFFAFDGFLFGGNGLVVGSIQYGSVKWIPRPPAPFLSPPPKSAPPTITLAKVKARVGFTNANEMLKDLSPDVIV